MKKKIFSITMSLLFVTSAFAFPFRTSCGRVVSVIQESGVSTQELINSLEEINISVCGELATIVIYTH